MSWLFSWDEAAKRPLRTVISMSLAGLVVGGLVGYFRFGDSPGYGIALGLGVAAVLGAFGWRTVHDPERVAALSERRLPSSRALGRATLRLGLALVLVAAVAYALFGRS